MQVDKKRETMRKTILSQGETIRRLSRDIESLAVENERLKADAERAETLCREYRELIAGIKLQRDRYDALNKDMERLKSKLRKAVNHR